MLNCKLQDTNYRAKVVKIDRLEPHENADKLQIAIVDFQRIITGLETKIGDLFIYFPLESQLNSEFLSFINGYSEPLLNRDKEKKGFFSSKGRVKATRLRGVVSEGYIHPVESFNSFLKDKKIKFEITEKDLESEFDSVGDLHICNKYIIKEKGLPNVKKEKEAKILERLIDGQFRLSPDYLHLKRSMTLVNPDDFIEITSKWHGCNAVISRILTKRKLSIFEKLFKFLGARIEESEYSLVFASRRCLKSEDC